MKCFYPMCNVSLQNGGTLFRVNKKGTPAVLACRRHIKNTDATISPEVDKVVKAIEHK